MEINNTQQELEIQKAKIELKKAELELEKTKKENNNKLLKYESYIKLFGFIFLGIPLVLLLYNEFALPMAKRESLQAEVEYKETELLLKEEKIKLRKLIDSLNISINTKEKELRSISEENLLSLITLKNKIDQLESDYDSIVKINPRIKNEKYFKYLRNQKKILEKSIQKDYITITTNIPELPKLELLYSSLDDFQDLLNTIYLEHLKNKVEAYTYGNSWVLEKDNMKISKIGRIDERPLKEIGIGPQSKLYLRIK